MGEGNSGRKRNRGRSVPLARCPTRDVRIVEMPMRRVSRPIIAVLALTALAGVLASSPSPGQPAGERYALLVGVRQYDPTEPLPPLAYPEDDMEELAKVLVAANYPRENIKLMTQRAGADRPRFSPEAAKIRKEFDLTLKRLDP